MRIASIERLPTEILQPIFALSGYNLALIQASQILGTRLSSEYVYKRACDYFLTGACDDYIMRSRSQSSIFASKWMTWTFLKRWILKTFESSGCLCGRTPDEGCFDAQWPPNFENATSMVFSRSHLPRLAFIHCRLPKKLLTGPWTSDKVQFLRFLLWITSMTVDWRDPESHRLAIEGRRQAFLENNLEAVELFNHNRRLGRPPTLETVQFAAKEASCSRSIIYDTVLSVYVWSPGSDTWGYGPLIQWCDERIWDNDAKGKWLRGVLQSLLHSQSSSLQGATCSERLFDMITDTAATAYSEDFDDEFVRNDLPWNKVRYTFFYMRTASRYMCLRGAHILSTGKSRLYIRFRRI
jgi:hypothetical protein